MPNRVYQVFPLVGTTILLPDGKPAGLPFRGIPSLDQSEILVVSGTEVQGVSTVDPVALAASAAWEFDPSRLAQVPVPGVVDPGDPEPPPGEGDFANEPAGRETLTDRSFNALSEDGWQYNVRDEYSIIEDPSDPMGTGFVGQTLFEQGMAGGNSPTWTWRFFSDTSPVVYVAFWVKVSENWVGHPSGVNKVGYIYTPAGHSLAPGDVAAPIIWSINGGGGPDVRDSFEPWFRLQGVVMDGWEDLNRRPNVNLDVMMYRDTWHLWESVIDLGSPGGADGLLRWWIDGVEVGHHTGLAFIPSDGASEVIRTDWHPVWGGVGSEIPSDQYMWMARFYVSAPGPDAE